MEAVELNASTTMTMDEQSMISSSCLAQSDKTKTNYTLVVFWYSLKLSVTVAMVQSINTKAIVALASIVRRPGLLVPQISIHTVSELNFTAMKQESGIRAIVFDKDNTLTAPYENVLHPAVVPGLRRAIEAFGLENVAILSNSAGTRDDVDYADAIEIEAALGIRVIRHDEKKPGGLQEMLDHFQLEDPATICIVGDRVLTDIVFGNLYGLLTVHCLPLCSGPENVKDNWTAKMIRPVENAVLYSNWFGSRLLDRRRFSHKFWKGPVQSPLLLRNSTTGNDR